MSDSDPCMCFRPDCERCWGELAAAAPADEPDGGPAEDPWTDCGGEG